MEIVVEKGTGNLIGTVIRQNYLSQVHLWSPIGFTLNKGANMLHAKGEVLEDLIEFTANLTRLKFEYTGEPPLDDYCVLNVKGDVITSDMIQGQGIKCITPNVRLLTSLDKEKPMELAIYFRYDKGVNSMASNQEFLQRLNINMLSIKVISSIHTGFKRFKYHVEEISFTEEKLIIDCDDEAVVKDAINASCEMFQRVANSV